jgi:trimethylguanosine synthase
LATAFSPFPDPSSPPKSAKALPIAIDLFAGAGGNTIPLGLSTSFSHVIAIEKDTATLACAQHNAYVNEVPDKAVTWILGDSFDFLARLKSNSEQLAGDLSLSASLPKGLQLTTSNVILFASPPWGGVSYVDHEIFDLATMEPYNLATLHEACSPMPHALYLPRTSDVRQLAKLVPRDRKKKMDVVQYCMYGASKAMVAYFPAAAEQTTVMTNGVNGVNGTLGTNETHGTNGINAVIGVHETNGVS